jgi:hypothetical protein
MNLFAMTPIMVRLVEWIAFSAAMRTSPHDDQDWGGP